MKVKILLPLLLSILALLTSCSPMNDGSQKRRIAKISSPEQETPVIPSTTPYLVLDQEVQNCSETPKCHLENFNEPVTNNKLNAIIYADSDIMSGNNINEAPAISFIVKELDASTITATRMQYIKKDNLGELIIQNNEIEINNNMDNYTVPIHSSVMGSGILISAPYEKHILNIKIKTSDNKNYDLSLEFFISSNTINPVLVERDTQIMNSSYYKMDGALDNFLIDSISLRNTLPFAVVVDGEIDIINETTAFLLETHKVQQKSFLPKQNGYPYDMYNWYTSTGSEYGSSTALATYIIKLEKNGTEEELPISTNYNGQESVISYSDLEIEGNQNIKINVYANYAINNNLIGNHGQMSLFEGKSICSTVTPYSRCTCFFAPPDLHDDSLTALLFYNSANPIMLNIQNLYYPNCGNNVPNGIVTQQLSIVSHPQKTISLIGRLHRTESKYTITSWLKGYKEQDGFGSTTNTMDTLEAEKGNTNAGLLDPSLSYTGYIPGII